MSAIALLVLVQCPGGLRAQNYSFQDLSGLNLSGLSLSGANFTQANLRGANLANADLSGASFAGADLTAADLAGANLTNAGLTGGVFYRSRYTTATRWPAGFDASNKGMIGPGSNLAGLDLTGVDFRVADLAGTNLTGAKLAGAVLRGDLSRAIMASADLRWADLSSANLEGAVLTGARCNSATRWPPGLGAASLGVVLEGPRITIPPRDQAVTPGQSATFSVAATGREALRYQWYRAGRPIPGATSPTFSISSVTPEDGGEYSVDVAEGLSTRVLHVAAQGFSMFTTTGAGLWGMGRNSYGELLDGTVTLRSIPVRASEDAIGVAVGKNHSAWIQPDGSLWTVGWNDPGQLGDGTVVDRRTPVKIATEVKRVIAGEQNTLFIRQDDTLWATGSNYAGQFGDGTRVNRTRPFQIASEVVSVATGIHHTLFVRKDGSLWGMGRNTEGQLGIPDPSLQLLPVQVMAGVAEVAAGFFHTVILRRDGTAWTCGYNSSGQLGEGTRQNRFVPVQVASGVTAVGAGGGLSLLLHSDGSLWTMGNNDYGKLGDGTTVHRAWPVRVSTDVLMVAGGWAHTLWVRRDGSLWSCGINNQGQLGLGSLETPSGPSPVPNTGVVTAAATLHVAPVIVAGPAGGTHVSGSPLTLTVQTRGFPEPSHQWFKDGLPLTGATKSQLTLEAVTPADAGDYFVMVSNVAGSVLSASAGIAVTSVAIMHSADVNADYRIGLTELTRVIELYNTLHGLTRTGAYSAAAGVTEDGFAIDPLRPVSAFVNLVRHHSADTNRDGKIGLLELTRVIELYNHRSGNVRTGQYRIQSGTEDGFAPGS